MTTPITLEDISRYLDGELPEPARRELERRLKTDTRARTIVERFRDLTRAVSQAALTTPTAHPDTPIEESLDEETLLRLAEGNLTQAEKEKAESLVASNARSLLDLMQHLRATTAMHAGNWPALPEAVGQRREVRHLVHVQEAGPRENWEEIRLVLREENTITRVASDAGVVVTIELTALPSDQARLRLFAKRHLRPARGQTVLIVDAASRRKFFTGRCDAAGGLEVARLPEGRYQLHFPGTNLRVELCIEQEA